MNAQTYLDTRERNRRKSRDLREACIIGGLVGVIMGFGLAIAIMEALYNG